MLIFKVVIYFCTESAHAISVYIIPSGTECVCCKEITEMVNEISSEGDECIILHPGFQIVCLSQWVLETAYYSYSLLWP